MLGQQFREPQSMSLQQPPSIEGSTAVPSQSFYTIFHGETTSVISIDKFRPFLVSGSNNKWVMKQLVFIFGGSFHEIARCFNLMLTGCKMGVRLYN